MHPPSLVQSGSHNALIPLQQALWVMADWLCEAHTAKIVLPE